jgi:hypothetical protein
MEGLSMRLREWLVAGRPTLRSCSIRRPTPQITQETLVREPLSTP